VSRRNILIFVIMSIALLAVPVSAGEPSEAYRSTIQGLDEEDLDQVRDIFAKLNAASENTEAADGSEASGLEDAALMATDKMLDFSESAISFLSTELKEVCPKVWQIAMLHQWAKIAQILFLPLALLLATFILQRPFNKKYLEYFKDLDSADYIDSSLGDFPEEFCFAVCHFCVRYVIPYACYIIFGIWTVTALTHASQIFINPKYYAIMDLVALIKGVV